MMLIEHVEKARHAELLPLDPARAAFVARWPSTPRTLVELWDFCGGERTNVLFVLARAAMRSFPAARECGSQIGSISGMKLANPGTLVWNAEHAPWHDPRLRASWVQVTDGSDALFVDEQGAVLLWSNVIDDPVLNVHPSFDAWMRETAIALRDGVVRIAPEEDRPGPGAPPGIAGAGHPLGERVIRGDLIYEFDAGVWWDSVRRREL